MTKRKDTLDLKPVLSPGAPQASGASQPRWPDPDTSEAAEGARDLLLAHISHGFRTPLNAIIGFSEIMEREMFGKIGIPRYIEYVKDIRASAQHLLRLIEDVVDLSKAEAGALIDPDNGQPLSGEALRGELLGAMYNPSRWYGFATRLRTLAGGTTTASSAATG